MLEVQDLNKFFGTLQALKGLNLRIQPSEIFGFVESDDAGKTTAMRIMLGMLSIDSGRVSWSDKKVDNDVCRKIDYMSEERGLYPKMQVERQLEYFARLHRLDKAEAARATGRWTDRLRVAGRRNDNVQEFSLGSQQHVQLAMALVRGPIILVLDEPLFDLDPAAVDVMSRVLKDKTRSDVPVIFSSHQLDPVERLCNRVGIVSRGSIVAEDTIHELRNTGKPRIALAASAGPDKVHVALASAGAKSQPDPLEGTSDAPSADGLTRVIVNTEEIDDQAPFRVALSAGPVCEFAPRRLHLADLFRNMVVIA